MFLQKEIDDLEKMIVNFKKTYDGMLTYDDVKVIMAAEKLISSEKNKYENTRRNNG